MIHHGDLFDVLPTLAEASIDACVTDPPYEMNFMSKQWDKSGVAFRVETWQQVYRVLKPGAHLLAAGIGRTHHRMMVAVEDAGFEIRDCIYHLFGSGFPKSLDVSKAIDEAAGQIGHSVVNIKRKLQNGVSERRLTLAQLNQACGFEASGYLRESSTWATVLPSFDKWIVIRDVLGLSSELDELFREAEREVIGYSQGRHAPIHGGGQSVGRPDAITAPATDAAKQWVGWGTALKPAAEIWTLFRKPLIGTVAQNVLTHGTGALNIDACRIEAADGDYNHPGNDLPHTRRGREDWRMPDQQAKPHNLGRWPANVLLDEEAAAMLDAQSGQTEGRVGMTQHGSATNSVYGTFKRSEQSFVQDGQPDFGGASRYFYCAKPSREERDYGCWDLPAKSGGEATDRVDGSAGVDNPRAGAGRTGGSRNHHPTVKPVELMRWLVRLVTPPGGTVLDCFAGSGTTGMACRYELRPFIGIEREAEYVQIAERRIAACAPLFSDEATA